LLRTSTLKKKPAGGEPAGIEKLERIRRKKGDAGILS
jgi:hypothetical protein